MGAWAPLRGLRAGVVLVAGMPLAVAGVQLGLGSEEGSWPVFLVALAWATLAFALFKRGARGPTVALLSINALLLWPELTLRACGDVFDAGVVQFGFPQATDLVRLRRDPELFWTLRPGAPNTNSAGFLGEEFETPKPPGTFRAVFLGDSCTQQGFPKLVAWRLNKEAGFLARIGRERVESVNLGISGYSSYQGRAAARRWVGRLEPDVGFVYFGWNDHWQAYGRTDAERGRASPEDASPAHGSALLAFLVRRFGRTGAPLSVPRVSLEEYRANLDAIGAEVERAGGHVALVTAPTSYYGLGVPEYLVANAFAASDEQAIALHRQYNEAVRALAGERGWWLLDLELSAGEERAELARLFLEDGIHFTKEGLRWVADSIAAELVARLAPP